MKTLDESKLAVINRYLFSSLKSHLRARIKGCDLIYNKETRETLRKTFESELLLLEKLEKSIHGNTNTPV